MPDIFLIILGGICILAGIAGCILPGLPGPPISFAGLILLQLTSEKPFTTDLLLIYGGLTVFITLLEYIIPIYGAKRFSGTKFGMYGSAIGMVVGLFIIPPFGIIIGPFIGAFAGELAGGRNIREAIKSSVGSFIGFITGTLIKLVLSLAMAYHFVSKII